MNILKEVESDFEILPVISFKQSIVNAVRDNQIVVIIGETGSGKTTQIPQFFVDDGLLKDGRIIGITQPRRIAAITVAQRVCDERNTRLGKCVGYTVRFDDCTSNETKIKYMTDGILVRECLSDRLLQNYSIIMLDEAHERSLNTDILFGLLKAACLQRKELKLIITSATLDTKKFVDYFNQCPVLEVPGRVYPVDIYHSKIKQIMTASGPSNNSYIQAAVDIVLRIHQKDEDGHILVFLTGQEEIERACQLLKESIKHEDSSTKKLIVLPLYSVLSSEIQSQVFMKPSLILSRSNGKNVFTSNHFKSDKRNVAKHSSKDGNTDVSNGIMLRKCVIATNIAETSITVPHVKFVVDAGFVKQKVYDPTRGMEALVTVPISKISALQRAGRAGRTGPGQCYRLYSSECFNQMMDETIPEIKRTNLANTVLYLKAIGIQDIIGFDFIDAPSLDQISQALLELHLLGAIDQCGVITSQGRTMSQFPLDPHLSRCLIESSTRECNCLSEMITISAMLSVENIWMIPSKKKPSPQKASSWNPSPAATESNRKKIQLTESVIKKGTYNSLQGYGHEEDEENQLERAHQSLRHKYGDHFTYLSIYMTWSEDNRCSPSWCDQHFIHYRSMRTAKKIRDQLSMDANRILPKQSSTTHIESLNRRLSKALTAGYFMNAAVQCANESVYKAIPLMGSQTSSTSLSTEIRLLFMHPNASFQTMSPPDYVIYQDLVQGTKLSMRTVTRTELEYLDQYRRQWKYVSPNELSGRDIVSVLMSHDDDEEKAGREVSVGERKEREKSGRDGVEEEMRMKKKVKMEGVKGVEGEQLKEVASMEVNELNSAKQRYLDRKKQHQELLQKKVK